MTIPAASFRFDLGNGAGLERIETRDTEAVHELIEVERERLDAHDSWATPLRSCDDVGAWIAALRLRDAANERVTCLIRQRDVLAGIVGLNDIDAETLSASLWIWVAVSEEGRGLAARACRATLGYGFDALGLERVTYLCDVRNLRSRKLAVRVGFRPEGILARNAILGDHTVVDHLLHGMTRARWPAARAAASEESRVRRARREDGALLRELGVSATSRRVWVIPGRAALSASSPKGGVAQVTSLRHVGGASRVRELSHLTRIACGELACDGALQLVLADGEPSLTTRERAAQGWLDLGGVWARSFLDSNLPDVE